MSPNTRRQREQVERGLEKLEKEMYEFPAARVDELIRERDEARAEVERLRPRATTGYDFVSLQRDEALAQRDEARAENAHLRKSIANSDRDYWFARVATLTEALTRISFLEHAPGGPSAQIGAALMIAETALGAREDEALVAVDAVEPRRDQCKQRNEAQARVDELIRERDEADAALWECVKLSGEDVSAGPPRRGTRDWPRLPELAVRAVRELREAAVLGVREEGSQDACPVCHGKGRVYFNGGLTTCDGCGGDGRNHYPAKTEDGSQP